MKTKILLFTFLLHLLLLAKVDLNGQPPCQPSTISYFFSLPHLQNYPPINSGMPYETIIGYIVSDSVCKTFRADTLNSFIQKLTFNDTLKYFMKYYYWMVDYNPLVFLQYTINSPQNYLKPRFIEEDLNHQIWKSTKSVALDLISESYYILHVYVSDTINVENVNWTGYGCKNMTVVSSQVIDTLKGKVIPMLESGTNNIAAKNSPKLQTTGNIFIFNFCNQWERINQVELNDGNGNAWLLPNFEYILFLKPRIICNDSTNSYISMYPIGNHSQSFGMYRIQDGLVHDIGNDFGLGEYVPVAIFKQNLQTLINQIKYYLP